MSLRAFLVAMTAVAVVSDTLLHPFYPQYFESVFGVTDPRHVGYYIGACSFTVLVAFPGWAALARRYPVLHLLIATQLATAALNLVCYAAQSLVQFWVVSLVTMAFKASYLLIYPYVLSLEDKKSHLGTISLLAFVVYFGNIASALLSGTVFELTNARLLFVTMAAGDVLQILLCLYALARPPAVAARANAAEAGPPAPRRMVHKLGVVMFVLYFSAYLTEPFFAAYWEAVSAVDNKIVSGAVFAIPGAAALLALYLNSRSEHEAGAERGIWPAIVLGVCGLLLQLSGQVALVVLGRFVYGWALFQAMVRLDALLFSFSSPDEYAADFGKINLFQGVGVLFASFTAGSLVSSVDIEFPFLLAALGFVAGVLLYLSLLRDSGNGEALEHPETITRGTAQ